MRLINPVDVSGRILSLLEEAEKALVIITTLADLKACETLLSGLKNAKARGVEISLFVEVDSASAESVYDCFAQVQYVKKLHSKIYINENRGIITSVVLSEAPARFSFDYGMETESIQELDAIKKNFLEKVEKTSVAGKQQDTPLMQPFEDMVIKKDLQSGRVESTLPTKLKIFKAHFQKTFRGYQLVHNKEKHFVSCSNFPLSWINFEYAQCLKFSFQLPSTFDFQKFRQENVDEFNERFRNHHAYWNYPYDSIQIFGNETVNGINPYDINAQMSYLSWLTKEVIKFLQAKEEVVLNSALYTIFKSCLIIS